MKILIDMNLTPAWVRRLEREGWEARHWSTVGDPKATDRAIMDWATAHDHIVFTHDLDFATMLALTHATGPSVLQIRGRAILPDEAGDAVSGALSRHSEALRDGALIVLDAAKARIRVLPL